MEHSFSIRVSDRLFKDRGIVHQSNCVCTPRQNSVVERKYRHLLNVAHALRFQTSLSLYFWGHFVLTSAYLINLSPSSVFRGKSPFEILHKTLPSYSHLRVFGCLAYVTVLGIQDKFAARQLHVFLLAIQPHKNVTNFLICIHINFSLVEMFF